MNIYIHTPFCRSKCAYCAFLSLTDLKYEDHYVDALLKEIELRKEHINQNIETIYFGGGTPSLLKAKNLEKIFLALEGFKKSNKCEITLEANPENITKETLLAWKGLGVNRVSIGVQSLNNSVRKTIGRNLDFKKVLKKVELAKNVIDNVGVDLIEGLPGDDWVSTRNAIDVFVNMGINHISLYDLELSKGSSFVNYPEQFQFLSEAKRQEILINSWKLLKSLGFEQYEISNFARAGRFTQHNLDFWLGKDYLGFGLGAVSKIENCVYNNTPELEKYLKGEYLASKEQMNDEDTLVLKLANRIRLNKDIKDLEINAVKIAGVIRLGLLDDEYKVTQKGKLYNDYFLRELI